MKREKKIEVTEKDFIKATARMCANNEDARGLIDGVPGYNRNVVG